MRITKVYTRTGDNGTTRLVGGQSVSKDDARIEAYGSTDELNAVIGLVRAHLPGRSATGAVTTTQDPLLRRLDEQLEAVQNDLFNVGTDLATPEDARWEGMYRVGDADVARLEAWIDAWNADLPPLAEFILPGGGVSGSYLHLARTVCRRAERRAISLARLESLSEGCVRYLNRLSDYLFVAGRRVALALEIPEPTWKNPNANKPLTG